VNYTLIVTGQQNIPFSVHYSVVRELPGDALLKTIAVGHCDDDILMITANSSALMLFCSAYDDN